MHQPWSESVERWPGWRISRQRKVGRDLVGYDHHKQGNEGGLGSGRVNFQRRSSNHRFTGWD